MANNIKLETVTLNEKKDAVVIIDQTLLPGSIEFKELRTGEEIYEAIYKLRVRGAPAIGVCAALGIYVIVNSLSFEEDTQENSGENFEELYSFFSKEKAYIDSSRPTAVNLSWALKRMERKLLSLRGRSLTMAEVKSGLLSEAEKIREEDIKVCRSIGENALSLLKPGDGIITHCNAGALATVKYGTATSALYLGLERGYNFKVYCDETRPLLQGARLTAFELSNAGLDVTVLCDNMSSSLMKTGKINAAIVGCDRVTENGDTANKIGTSLLALAAKHYGVPFYIAAPTSTIDISLRSGDEIPIEHRADDEVTEMWYKKRMAPENIKVYNPAFDVTDHSLITAIITERGVVYPGEDGVFHLKKLFE